jgi:outer membrane protein OmpA-like peptidoglycan-associated protein
MTLPFKAYNIKIKDGSENIELTSDKTLIYFKYNSDQRIQETDIEKYLTGLAAQHKDSRATIHITGHTDNVGDSASNLKLGLHRQMQ